MSKKENIKNESARLEHCMKCGSTEVRNNLFFYRGRRVRVYVQCLKCGEYVARYTLSGYTSDEPYESLLQKLRFTRLSSGKRALSMIEEFGDDIEEEFERVVELIRTNEDQRRIEEIIEEDFPDSLE